MMRFGVVRGQRVRGRTDIMFSLSESVKVS